MDMKIVSVVGARPEFIQATPIRRALAKTGEFTDIWVHTGQHYDYRMSQTFFDQLDIPSPDYFLGAGSGSHAQQTAAILTGIEEVLQKEQPALVIVRGDTNSTLAGALAAAKLRIPVAHIEAGERSFDRRMPEEINRLAVDSISRLHFCVSRRATQQLRREGMIDSVYHVGDVMLDAMNSYRALANETSQILETLELESGKYALVTVHRAANTDNPNRLGQLVDSLNAVEEQIVFPVHPRTRRALEDLSKPLGKHIRLCEPVGYLDMICLEENARLIATDSGGVQREAYFLGKPCLTLRDETEWVETIETGWNTLVGVSPGRILTAWHTHTPPAERPPIFGEGDAGKKIVEILERVMPSLASETRWIGIPA